MNTEQEWKACQNESCIIPLNSRSLIEIKGKDRGSFLQGLFSQDVAKNFPVGSAAYGVFPNIKGKILADAFVYHVDENRFFLDVEKFALPLILKHLDQYLILLSAEIKESNYTRLSLLGPKAPNVLKELIKEPLKPNSCTSLLAGNGFVASMTRRNFHEFSIWIDPLHKSKLLESLQENETPLASKEVYEILRIESGVPKLGQEMDETTFPQEVGLEEFLNFQKGCFIGAEVLQRIFYQGHVNRMLALFSIDTLLPLETMIFQDGK